MRFAWYGFSIEHPDDWSPVTLSGDRREGFVRIASPNRPVLLVRWSSAGKVDLRASLDRYLDRLSLDAKRSKSIFSRHAEEKDGQYSYKYSGRTNARGAALQVKERDRVFFIEVQSSKSEALTSILRAALTSFEGDALERWALLGLDFTVSAAFEVAKKQFFAGRTHLALTHRRASLVADRWGLAEQLLENRSLEDWANGFLGMRSPTLETSAEGLRFTQKLRFGSQKVALVQHQPHYNQIVVLQGSSRVKELQPSWAWLN